MLRTEFEYKLLVPFKRPNSETGQEEDVKTIVLSAPANKHRAFTAKLKQGFYSAVNALQKNNDSSSVSASDDQDAQLDGNAAMALLLMSDIDYAAYLDAFEGLLLSGIAKVNGHTEMIATEFGNMSDVDCEAMLGEYLTNFLLYLWTKMQAKKK
jgi:hypothetical protein